MNSQHYILSACDLSTNTIASLNDKETQTSIIYPATSFLINTKSSRPVPHNIENKNEGGKVFEFCEVIQDPDDPESLTIIKETFTEEVITTPHVGGLYHTPSKNKFKYCREVIQPYNKPFPGKCPFYPTNKCCNSGQSKPDSGKESSTEEACSEDTNEEICCQKSLEEPCSKKINETDNCRPQTEDTCCEEVKENDNCIPKEGNPINETKNCMPLHEDPCSENIKNACPENKTKDCPPLNKDPCLENTKEAYPERDKSNCEPSPETLKTDCCDDKMDCGKPKSTFVNPELKCPECQKKKEVNHSSCCSISNIKNAKAPCPTKPECEKPKIDECKLKSCIATCINEGMKLAKKSSSTCCEKVIGIKQPKDCEEKPTFYVMKKPKSREPSSSCIPQKSSVEKLLEAQSKTVATISCAIKDFVGSVYNKTRDCVKLMKTNSCTIQESEKDKCIKDKCGSKTRVCSNVPSEINTQILFENINDENEKEEKSNEDINLEKLLEPARVAVERVASVVESTISVAKSSSFEQIADDIINAKFNKSSAFDQPRGSTPPRSMAQDHEPNTSSMFTLIKTKLLSMFGEKPQENCQDDDEEEEDDERSAEKLFEKFCDQ